MRITFRGGVHPIEHKDLSCESALRLFDPKGEMVFPLSQHIGKPAKPVVQKGDAVLVGQTIAEADGYVSASVISSCSGTVKAVEKRRLISGAMAECVVIDNDGQFTLAEGVGKETALSSLSEEDILSKIQKAGIVGLGGAGFPAHVKFKPKDPSAIKYVIANGAECEPYLTCNDRLMREAPETIVAGLLIVLRLFPNARGIIAIEKNKPEAIAAMKTAAGATGIEVRPLRTKYPQGGEHNLIQTVTGIDYPVAKLPADVGCVVSNVGTLYAIERAVAHNEPLFTHVLTVSGDAVKNPSNFIVRDGTSFAELIEACGGVKEGKTVEKVLSGGPMMGFAVGSLDVPVQKTTNGILLRAVDKVAKAEARQTACLHCGRCTTVCPAGLIPQLMADAAADGNLERYENKLYGLECVACGSCTYICPAKRPLTQTFKQVKAEIMAKKRAAQAAGGAK
ncbi:MAG: electron transport complex subunit RsxC [Clostridia bacterium]|nr:electron transport complex subunit RsxC [Clostridia bacterium]